MWKQEMGFSTSSLSLKTQRTGGGEWWEKGYLRSFLSAVNWHCSKTESEGRQDSQLKGWVALGWTEPWSFQAFDSKLLFRKKKNCGCQVNHMYECVAYNSAVNTKNVSVSSIWRRLHAALAVLTFVMALQTTLGKSHLDPRLWGHHEWWWWWPWLYFDFWFTKHFTYIILPLCLILYLTSFEMMSIMAMIISSSTIIRNYFFIYVRCFNSGPCYVARLV